MSYDVTGLKHESQLNVNCACDNNGIGFQLEIGWGWISMTCILGIIYFIFKCFFTA